MARLPLSALLKFEHELDGVIQFGCLICWYTANVRGIVLRFGGIPIILFKALVNIPNYENPINTIVYDLYGLTEDEIAFIESIIKPM